MAELDPAITTRADELARWLYQQAGYLREAAARLPLADTELAHDVLRRIADFTQILVSSYQCVRRKLDEERNKENFSWDLTQHREGTVFSCRSWMELLAGQVYRHPDYLEEVPTAEEMGYFIIER